MTSKTNAQPVPADETANDLPDGWAFASTADLFTFVTSGSRGWAQYYAESGALFLRIANLNHDSITIDLSKKKYVKPPRSAEGSRTRVAVRDLLISITADVGMIGLVKSDLGEAYVNQHIALARPVEGIDDGYLAWYITSTSGQKQLGELQRGATKVGLGLDDIHSINVPFAPIVEQRRIALKIEELLQNVNASRERLAKVPKILKAFRQSVLAAACSGRLTEDWREEHQGVEGTEAAFHRVFAARGGERKKRSSLVGSAVEPSFAPSFRVVDDSELPDIPASWMYAYLPEAGYMNRGTSRHRPRNAPHLYGGPYPFIQTGDVARSGGRIVTHEQTYSKAGLAQSRLWPAETICITIAANIADSAILIYPACFPDSIVGVIADPELSTSEYLEYFVRTTRSNLAQYAPATAQANINIAILSDVAVPMPPLEEQIEIVRRVEILFKLADKIEKRVEGATKRADKLTQAILANAFRGQLVPTEAELARTEGRDYEPASVLLERIKAEREASALVPKNGTGRKRRSAKPEKKK